MTERRQRMCPNESCPRYLEATRLLGGCDCGSALVPYYSEPTTEQLARFALFVFGVEGQMRLSTMLGIIEEDEAIRRRLLEEHQRFQLSISAPAS